uniref:GRF-type domain-containing protein n=1 Tax=Solanum lycopersicum TaxID=4081 RepID=A0A3Q7FXR2_SOLLC
MSQILVNIECGYYYRLKTSRTHLNPGRRFFGCKSSKENGGCGYFRWIDPSLENVDESSSMNRLIDGQNPIDRLKRKPLSNLTVVWVVLGTTLGTALKSDASSPLRLSSTSSPPRLTCSPSPPSPVRLTTSPSPPSPLRLQASPSSPKLTTSPSSPLVRYPIVTSVSSKDLSNT